MDYNVHFAIWFIWCSGGTRAPYEPEQSYKKEKEFRLVEFFDFLSNGIKFLAYLGDCKVEDPHLLLSISDLVHLALWLNQSAK